MCLRWLRPNCTMTIAIGSAVIVIIARHTKPLYRDIFSQNTSHWSTSVRSAITSCPPNILTTSTWERNIIINHLDVVQSKMYKTDVSEPGGPTKWQWNCTDCNYSSAHGTTVKRHIESKHIGSLYVCDICQHRLSTQNALNIHKIRLHSNQMFIE